LKHPNEPIRLSDTRNGEEPHSLDVFKRQRGTGVEWDEFNNSMPAGENWQIGAVSSNELLQLIRLSRVADVGQKNRVRATDLP
jgi:hypothetical protein